MFIIIETNLCFYIVFELSTATTELLVMSTPQPIPGVDWTVFDR